ncbi:MAG: chitosanase [Anaerolineae bacterium]
MASTPFLLNIRGVRENPSIKEINVRSGPNTTYTLLFKIAVGISDLPVLEARSDDQNANLQGKTYQWLRTKFPNGQEGWVRDDLIDVHGDGRRFGYGILPQPVIAFALARDTRVTGAEPPAPVVPAAPPVTTPAPAPPPAVPAPTPATSDTTPTTTPSTPVPTAAPTPGALDRVRRAAFAITSAFEGGGYATYQTYDSGIISYGRFQFTLAAGSFQTVITRYTERASGPTADGLRGYLPRIQAKDEGLRKDDGLKTLCKEAAKDLIMQQVQDEVATEGYWEAVIDLSIAPRGIQSALGHALIFDTAINHGRFNHLIPKTETELGVPSKSKVGANGVTEKTFVTKLAQLRKDNLYALAEKLKLPGLKVRGDFWVDLVASGDWNLQGDNNGNLNVKGKIVQVRTPT